MNALHCAARTNNKLNSARMRGWVDQNVKEDFSDESQISSSILPPGPPTTSVPPRHPPPRSSSPMSSFDTFGPDAVQACVEAFKIGKPVMVFDSAFRERETDLLWCVPPFASPSSSLYAPWERTPFIEQNARMNILCVLWNVHVHVSTDGARLEHVCVCLRRGRECELGEREAGIYSALTNVAGVHRNNVMMMVMTGPRLPPLRW